MWEITDQKNSKYEHLLRSVNYNNWLHWKNIYKYLSHRFLPTLNIYKYYFLKVS